MAMAYLNGVNRKTKIGWSLSDLDPTTPGNLAKLDPTNPGSPVANLLANVDPTNPDSTIKHILDKFEEAVKNGLKVIAKIGLAPAKLAFIGLVKINVLKLAKRLAQLYMKSPESAKEMRDLWEKKFKGNWSTLRQAINQGANTSISGRKYKAGDVVGGQMLGTDGVWHDIKKGTSMGVIDPATATLISSAIPLITAFLALFKKHKSDKPNDGEVDAELIKQGAQTLLTDETTNFEIDGKPVTSNVPFYKNPIVLGVGAVAIVGGYMLMKRRK